MLTITITNTRATVTSGMLPLGSISFFSRNYTTFGINFHTKKPERKLRAVSVFDMVSKTFPTGLTYRFVKHLKEKFNTECEVVDNRRYVDHNYPHLMTHAHTMRFHQVEGYSKAIEYGRGVIVMPTGAGKTFVAMNILSAIGGKTLFVVNSIDLLNQAYDTFKEAFPETKIGIIGKSQFDPQDITVATIQTLWSRFRKPEVIKYLKSVEVLIGDEIHHVSMKDGKAPKKNTDQPDETYPGNSLFSVLQSIDAFWRFGFSATIPKEGSLRRLYMESTMGKVIYRVTYEDLRKAGLLADVRVFMVETPKIKKFSNYFNAYREGIQKNQNVHKIVVDITKYLEKLGKSTIVMVNRLTMKDTVKDADGNESIESIEGHAHILLKEFEKQIPGKALLLTGKSDEEIRTNARKMLIDKQCKIVLGTLLKEGVDIPTLDAAVYACGGRAVTETNMDVDSNACIQSLGRVLRDPAGDKKAVFVDFMFNDGGHLLKHSKERVEAYQEHGYQIIFTTPELVQSEIDQWLK